MFFLFHWVIAERELVHVVLICFLQPEKSGVGWRREASNSKITTKASPTQTSALRNVEESMGWVRGQRAQSLRRSENGT